ncbi:MAG: cytochrome c peroxidase [Bryobacteraceae bacterium]
MPGKFWVLLFACTFAEAQQLRSLKAVPIPSSPERGTYVRNQEALIQLGKALFWDMQTGSDGRSACATCHFHAGADHRVQNQAVDPNAPFPLNLALDQSLFPLRVLSNPANRNSPVLRDSSMRIGSAGLYRRKFIDIVPGQATEIGADLFDKPEFIAGDLQVRRVTVRNSPTIINSVFNVLNFWDGRANQIFDGFTVAGTPDATPGIAVVRNGTLVREQVRITNASLASQAVGPALDHLEMSYEGRTWPKLGRKMLSLRPLALQKVATDDSVLGSLAQAEGRGLQDRVTYLGLIQEAFQPAYWESSELIDGENTQVEHNFSLFWGLAMQAYQATLVSNDSRFDRFQEGNRGALTAEEQQGLNLFTGIGNCNECHSGAEFTAASFSARNNNGTLDNHAFRRTGVRPIDEDTGRGDGNFKSTGLRNVELTGPYFHNGGQATLEQVIEFYQRGADFNPNNNEIRAFNLTGAQKSALVSFLKSLSDERVQYERAPFDHPEICVPAGHIETKPGALAPGPEPFPRSAAERYIAIPAVGSGGNAVPLQTFEELLLGIGTDGSRAHHMKEECTAPLP